ncbi:hypothetical protein DPMN_010710 [Dreissena polymorpha]|uniref:Uncharacterized protein n=1 Tax=Dreissena polymorpha TaxID=45954 RepID=A0A9D4S1S1_DREPO|nr:hypothetical protein DPMN_010710 [Dreissena polymorpha]
MFVRHVQCRWLTLVPSLQRILCEWEAVNKYLIVDLSKLAIENRTESILKTKSRYLRICNLLRVKETYAEIQFLTNAEPLFESFLVLFQNQEPLIHVFYSEAATLLKAIMSRFVKFDVVKNCKNNLLLDIDVKNKDHCLDVETLEVGGHTRKTLSSP